MDVRLRTRSLRVVALAMGAVVAFSGCGSDDPVLEGSAGASFNEADIEFLQQMKPHHEQAIEMAEMVEERTDRSELNVLAANVIESQSAEIEEIDRMLDEASESGGGDMGHGGMDSGMSQEDMDALAASEGEGFDKMFAEMMIEHHSSAIEMANEVLDAGENPDVASMARGIIAEQQKEIEDLGAWLEEWGL